MSDYTVKEVLEAFSEKFISDDRLYEEIGWEYYESKETDHAEHVKKFYEENPYAEPGDLLDWSEIAWELDRRPTMIDINGDRVYVECVQQLGGMDEGTTADVTFKVGDQFFTKRGWYQSHYGYEYDGDFEETVPVERVEYDYVRKS